MKNTTARFAHLIAAILMTACTASYTSINNPPPATPFGPNGNNPQGSKRIEKLGQRQKSCIQQKDQTVLVIPEQYGEQTLELLQKDQLKSFTFSDNQNCIRVGTEVSLELSRGEKRYLGSAFVTGMSMAPTSHTIEFDTMSRVFSVSVDQQDQRLPSCRSRGDWRSFYIGTENVEQKIQDLSSGTFRADIQNGALGCYRVGHESYVKTKRKDKEKRGKIVAQKLELLHMSELTQSHADLVNTSLQELLQKLEANKDKDGGFVNILVFNYIPPEEEPQ